MAAAAQNFNSIGIAFGSMIALSSYNDYHSTTLFRDTFIISCLNSLTSLFASLVIFSVIGYIAYVQDADIETVVTDGKRTLQATRSFWLKVGRVDVIGR